jgi:Mycoplasma protein of unknown function, DUF285
MFENTIYDRDLSPWDLSSAAELDRMFANATAFRQSLCNWQYTIPKNASVTEMFVGTDCPDTGDPDLTAWPVNPLCFANCTVGDSTDAPANATQMSSRSLLTKVPVAPTASLAYAAESSSGAAALHTSSVTILAILTLLAVRRYF